MYLENEKWEGVFVDKHLYFSGFVLGCENEGKEVKEQKEHKRLPGTVNDILIFSLRITFLFSLKFIFK
jgi:hypothetical protein